MAKTLYLTDTAAPTHRGDNTAKLNAAGAWWVPYALSETRGGDNTGLITSVVTTVLGATNGIEVETGGIPVEWISEPLSADFTISGTITLNLWAKESNNAANAAINAVVEKIDGATGALTQIVKTARVTELTTSIVAVSFTATPTSTACKRGDRLRVRVFADDAGTMAAAQTVNIYYDRSTTAQGESYLTFTETLTFESGLLDQPDSTYSRPFGDFVAATQLAQTFVVPAGFVPLTAVSATLGKVGSPTDNLIVEIQSNAAGVPSGTVVAAIATVAMTSLSAVKTPLIWACNVALTEGATYHLVLRRSGAINSSNNPNAYQSATLPAGWTASKRFDGSAWVTDVATSALTVAFTFTSTPSGSTYYLTDTAETINPGGAIEKKASTTRGSSSVNAVTNTAAGPTAPIQVTGTAGGTAVEWYTPPLEAFTLGGLAKLNVRGLESNAAANASLCAQIAIVNGDGTSAIVWGKANIEAITTYGAAGEINTTDTAYEAWVSGDDTAVTAGQRLRFRLYVEDPGNAPLVTGQTVTVSYSGTTAAAAGDTYVTLPVVIVEQSTGPATITGSATITGAGTSAIAGTVTRFAAASALTGTGTLTTAGTVKRLGAAALAGAGTLAVAGVRKRLGVAALTGAGTLTASGTVIGGAVTVTGQTTLTGTGTAAATGRRTKVGAAALTGAGSLSGIGTRTTRGAAALTGLGTLTAASPATGYWDITGHWVFLFGAGAATPTAPWGYDYVQTGSSVAGTGGYPAGGPYSYPVTITSGTVVGTAVTINIIYTGGSPGDTGTNTGTIAPDGAISGTWTDTIGGGRSGTFLTSTGVAVWVPAGPATITGAANLTGAGAATATGRRQTSATATASGTGALTAAGTRTKLGDATLTGTGALAATGRRTKLGDATLTGTGGLAVAGTRTRYGVAALTATGNLFASWAAGGAVVTGQAALTGQGALAATGRKTRVGAALLTGTGTMSTGGYRTARATVTLTGAGTITAAGIRKRSGTATLTGVGTSSATGRRTTYAITTLAGQGILIASGTRVWFRSATLTGRGTLVASGLIPALQGGALFGRGTLTATGVRGGVGTVTLTGHGSLAADGYGSLPAGDILAGLTGQILLLTRGHIDTTDEGHIESGTPGVLARTGV